MRLACHEDFEAENGLYWPPFQDCIMFARRAEYLAKTYPGKTVLIVGPAYGFLVEHCLRLGMDAWGLEASAWALEQAKTHCPEALSRLVHGDALNEADLVRVAVLAGVDTFGVAVTEDVMPMLTVGEVEQMKVALHRHAKQTVHYVTPAPVTPHPSIVTAKDEVAWREALFPDTMIRVG